MYNERKEKGGKNSPENTENLWGVVEGVRKITVNIDPIQSGKLASFLGRRMIAVAGETITGEKDVQIALPTLSTEDPDRKFEAIAVSIQLRRRAIENACRSGLISVKEAEKILDGIDQGTEPRPPITFADTPGLRAEAQANRREQRKWEQVHLGRDLTSSKKTSGLGETDGQSYTWQAPAETTSSKVNKKRVLLLGGTAFAIGACAVVPQAVRTATSVATQEPVSETNPTPFQPQGENTPIATALATTEPSSPSVENEAVCSLGVKEQAEKLFPMSEEELAAVQSVPLLSEKNSASYVGEQALQEAVEGVRSAAQVLAANGNNKVEIPSFASSLSGELKEAGMEVDIRLSMDKEQKDGFSRIDVIGFPTGGWMILIKGEDGLVRAVLPSGEESLQKMQALPGGEATLFTLPAQRAFGETRWVKIEGCQPVAIQVYEGKVTAVLNPDGTISDINSVWLNNPGVDIAQIQESVTKEAEMAESGQHDPIEIQKNYEAFTPEWATDTDLVLYKNPQTGRVEIAKLNGGKYPAEYIHVEGRPDVLLLTSPAFLRDTNIDGYLAFKEDKIQEGSEGITQAYLNALAIAKLRSGGVTNPSLGQVRSEAQAIAEILQNGGELQGVFFTDPEGKQHALTGKPLIFIISPYAGRIDPWPGYEKSFTYTVEFKNDMVIVTSFMTSPNYVKDMKGIDDDELLRLSHVHRIFEQSLVSVLQLLAGVPMNEVFRETYPDWYNSERAAAIADVINSYYRIFHRTWNEQYYPAVNPLAEAGNMSEVARIAKDKNLPYSIVNLMSNMSSQSFFTLVQSSIDLFE